MNHQFSNRHQKHISKPNSPFARSYGNHSIGRNSPPLQNSLNTPTNPETFKAFLTGFAPDYNIKDLKSLLRLKYKGLGRIEIPRNFTNGCVFLYFKNEKYLKNCLSERVFDLGGRQISIKEALSGKRLAEFQQDFKHRRLFIGRVPFSFDSDDLLRIFSAFGEIE